MAASLLEKHTPSDGVVRFPWQIHVIRNVISHIQRRCAGECVTIKTAFLIKMGMYSYLVQEHMRA